MFLRTLSRCRVFARENSWYTPHSQNVAPTFSRFCSTGHDGDVSNTNKGPKKRGVDMIFENNRKWVKEMKEKDPEFFKRLAGGQSPRFLFIGCSDSRVPANEICGLSSGDLFVHRNIANLVVNSDINVLSVLQYAVEKLKVRDIIVCGHYGCGGVEAAMQNKDHGLIDHWLRNIRDVSRLYHTELAAISDKEARHRRLIELNVVEQCLNLFKNGIVQRHQQKYGYPHIHGLVYDIGHGILNRVNVDFREYTSRYRDIYRLYDFRRNDVVFPNRHQLQIYFFKELFSEFNEADEESYSIGGVDNDTMSLSMLKAAMRKEPDLFTKNEVEYLKENVKTTADGMVHLLNVLQVVEDAPTHLYKGEDQTPTS